MADKTVPSSVPGAGPKDNSDAVVKHFLATYKPEPYHREADETIQCPYCHKFNSNDARYCDQCGHKL